MGTGTSSGKTQGITVQMPTLTGTDKQVKWANDIRDKAISAAKQTT